MTTGVTPNGPTSPVEVGIVPHTHWDREWYAPFETFRVKLVSLVDDLLDLLEDDLSYARFLLDGQTAVLDDYLEIRPEAAPRLARLAAGGRLQVGPWMILMDEFMVSGETMVRDLQLGMRRATELGGAMQVGYLPDMFGHVAQMPQILRSAGFEHAVVWRGVPSEIDRTAFWWDAPDGSRVRAEYLYGSYSNGRDLPDDAKQLIARARGYELELGDTKLPGGGLLLMNGTDHQLPQPWLGRVIAEANDIQDEYHFSVTSLAEYLPAQPVDDLPTWAGELRSGARSNVLMGVASNRVDVHRACAAAQRSIERVAEPLSALFVPAEDYPARLLDLAWRKLVLNSAHDSSCACSADDVVDAVTVRYQEARHIGEALAYDAVRSLAGVVEAEPGSTLVVNPTRADRTGVVTGFVLGAGPLHFVAPDGTRCPTQVLATRRGEGFRADVAGQKVRWVLDLMRGNEFRGVKINRVERRQISSGERITDGDPNPDDQAAEDQTPEEWEYTFHGAGPQEPGTDLEEAREEILGLGEAGATVRFRQELAPVREVAIACDAVPGFGWRAYRPVEEAYDPSASAGSATADDMTLANEHLRVTVDARDGTFAVVTADGVERAGCNRLVDGGDGGDTYSYSPPARDLIVDGPEQVTVHVEESGPVRARLVVDAAYRWPAHTIGDERSCSQRSDETVVVDVRTTLELRTRERFVRVRVEIDNRARDHRLRAHFPLPARVDGSDAECAFAVVHRGLEAEGGPQEHGLPTFVSQRFVDCSDGSVGLALVHDGLLEYEVVDGGRELALALLRATGYLSRADPALRPNPAGPLLPVVGPQLQGRHVVEYAVLPHRGDWHAAQLYEAADEVLVPLERAHPSNAVSGRRTGSYDGVGSRVAPTGRSLKVDGAQVSAVVREADALVVRVFNASAAPATATIERDDGPVTGWIVDLLGRAEARFEGSVELRPWQIATLRID